MAIQVMKVLFLTPWYPSERDAMAGLFVQKHADAVRAQGVEVRVISSPDLGFIHGYKALLDEGWKPDIVQLNVIQKQGLLALALSEKEHVPYIVVEHWSGYMPENGMYAKMSAFKQRFYRRVAHEAEMVLTVSEPLQRAMKASGIRAGKWGTIDNVVDDFFFETSRSRDHEITKSRDHETSKRKKTLLHVSCFDERAKNVKGLLRAAKMLSEKRQDWQLALVGTGADYNEVRAYAEKLGIPSPLLRWTGELPPRQVAEEMHRADAFVLSSRYETYGVVLAEAAAAGLPVLSTPVGIAQQTADLIVPQEIAQHKPGKFAEFMETILWNTPPSRQAADTERFSAEAVGRKLVSVYDSCMHHHI